MTTTRPMAEEAEQAPTGSRPAKRLVMTVHGIRTFGQWQQRLGRLLKGVDEDIEVRYWGYGYFSLLEFLFPPLRWWQTRRFRDFLERYAAANPGTRIDIVAHSFGTHMVGWALMRIPRKRRPKGMIDTIILSGSVLKSWFPWDGLIQEKVVRRVINECGIEDRILVLSQACVLMTGMAGRTGFNGSLIDGAYMNRFHRLGHSGYFLSGGQECDDFMRKWWVPVLTTEHAPAPWDERVPSTRQGFITFLLNHAEPIKVLCYSAPLILGLVWLNWVLQQTREAKNELQFSLGKTQAANRRAEGRADLALEAIRNFRQAVQDNPDFQNRRELASLRK